MGARHNVLKLICIALSFAKCSQAAASNIPANITSIFKRPVYSRVYNGGQYALAQQDRNSGLRVDISDAASAIAGLQPSYVSSTLYLSSTTTITDTMVSDFNTLRSAVLASSPNAKFDVEINLNTVAEYGSVPFTGATALVEFMETVDGQLHLDGWWFDFYSDTFKKYPEWISAAVDYAHSHNQTIGGNVFGNYVPTGSDAVSFVDNADNSTEFGFGFNAKEISSLQQSSSTAMILGHLQSNPQNGNSTESCVYMYDWNSTRRADYYDYWTSAQTTLGYTYMIPVFFPLCPGAFAFDPLADILVSDVSARIDGGNNATFYDYIKDRVLEVNGTSTATSAMSTTISSTGTGTATATSSTSTPTSGGIAFEPSSGRRLVVGALALLLLA